MTGDSVWQTAPQCSFYVRKQVTDGPPAYRYDHVYLRGGKFGQGGRLDTPHPPAVGDLIFLHDEGGPHTGNHRVVERAWGHASYGSKIWPHGTPRPTAGPLLDIIVVPDAGPFRNEAAEPDEEPTP